MLQSLPPSCVNRDGNNSPKDCYFGGVRRARISSQCLKRAIRTDEEFEATVTTAVRTKLNVIPARAALKKAQVPDAELDTKAENMVTQLSKFDSADKAKQLDQRRSAVLLFFGGDEWDAMAKAFVAGEKDWRSAAKPKSADVLLFGRMLAEAPGMNVEAACQVAHAISTNKLANVFDFWSAVDDKAPADNLGAGMLGSAAFNSSCFYRYSCVNVNQLAGAYGADDLAKATISAFLLATYRAIPTGKKSAFAHFSPPELMFVTASSTGAPNNLVNSFEKPIRQSEDSSLTANSARELARYFKEKSAITSSNPDFKGVSHCIGADYPELGKKFDSVSSLVAAVVDGL